MTTARQGYIVKTADGLIGRIYSDEPENNGSICVHLPDFNNPEKYGYTEREYYPEFALTIIGNIQ